MPKAQNQSRRKSSLARLTVSVVSHCRGMSVERQLLAKAVRLVAREHALVAGRVELAVFPDTDMARLNKEYLGKPRPTDVICFDMSQDEPGELEGDLQIKASLALGGDVARRQAKLNKTSINKELALYTVHGLLHLLGYNDAKVREAQRMHQREDELLSKLGIGAVFNKNKSSATTIEK